MKCLAYNPQKGRLETLEVEFTPENTTRFLRCGSGCVTAITDCNGGLLIKSGFDHPVYLYDVSRADIGYSQKKARELQQQNI
ncbi:hypothetical protein [Geoalkalibacter subterraneus]|jgi:hypothetical protein|uniref:Uncharacterized protein n=1 Tax=Geoalkalibacter subterraneus TaxID=483547 RepID=A0A0B5FRT0_9BACT|nr:hypothetical protein [Geoalkalibacter subterraneus]AJF06286.1 hypothetical protein GSUB_06565 [Geoalkalibacter subterraneus]AJF06299.1 hypothetical protein GSUB_06670 [Geoalkalibacter subterraneus]AJF06782.1 hypothetical protein GSUB_09810 [Geoalkalibacter subterraneus]AJF07320.1 hypothetical protein GSUB_13165 [Geoalkalibacter subterraneus]AJF07799.1 hypothetical protein GSUB_16285 [Geoalkalibacter subterraneus]